MIKDFQNKKVLAEMKRQLNKAAKHGDREARITFTLIHMISEHHELAEMASMPDGENNLYRFMWWNLDRMADEFELKPEDEYSNPIDIYRREEQLDLLELCRFRTPTKDAVKKGLEEWQEWPSDVPYEEWEDEMLQTAYITMFGLYYFDTPVKDLMRWLGKDEPKNPRFVNAMNRHETVVAISSDRMKTIKQKGRPRKQKTMYITDDEVAKGEEGVEYLREKFKKLVGELATGDTLRFCREKEETAFGVFIGGLFAMMMPGDDVNRKAMLNSKDRARLVYQAAKKTLMGEAVLKGIVTADDDNAAFEVFNWGLVGGEVGVSNGSMPTGLAFYDVKRKPGPKSKK